jgi:hypothetical protein
MFFDVFKSFLCVDVKNNFFKTNIILMCFEMKNILKNSRYHLSNTEPLGFLLF